MASTTKPQLMPDNSLSAFQRQAADNKRERDARDTERHEQDRIEALMSGYDDVQLVEAWRTGRDWHGILLTTDGFASLCQHLTRTFGRLPDGDCGEGEPLTARELATSAKDSELAGIDDASLLARSEAARLLGISIASLDRYVRRGEALGGVNIEPLRIGERGVRYRASDVKAVRKGLADQAAAHRAGRIRQQETGKPPSVARSTFKPAITKPSKKR